MQYPWDGAAIEWTVEPFRELYAHATDNGTDFDQMDVINVAYNPTYTGVVGQMQEQLLFFFKVYMPPSAPTHPPRKIPAAQCAAASGILDDDHLACCAKSCGLCGGKGCASEPGGKMACCSGEVEKHAAPCNAPGVKAPCRGGG